MEFMYLRRCDFSQPIRNYMDLRSSMKSAEMHRVFVKLACGSGASGVVAYQVNPRTGDEIAVTTLGMEQSQGKTIFLMKDVYASIPAVKRLLR